MWIAILASGLGASVISWLLNNLVTVYRNRRSKDREEVEARKAVVDDRLGKIEDQLRVLENTVSGMSAIVKWVEPKLRKNGD